jgi:hypothetical protein
VSLVAWEIVGTRSSSCRCNSLMTGMLEMGAFLGALMAGFVADKYSRKASILFGLIWFVLGSTVQTASFNYATLVAGRTLGGVGIGILSSTAPMYISEASQVSLDAVQEDCMLIDPLDEEQTGCTTKRSRGSARYGTIHHRPWHHRHVLHRKSTWRSTLLSSANH